MSRNRMHVSHLFIDVLTPGKELLSTLSPENREYFHSTVTSTLNEIATKYKGKVVYPKYPKI